MKAVKVPPPPRAMVPALAAVAGVVAAHVVDYAVLFPKAGVRADHLAFTGHSYWPAVVTVAVAAGAIALALTAGRGVVRGWRGGATAAPTRRRDLAWLLLCQGTAFVVMEAGERGLAGLPPSVVLRSPEFWLGLALQLPVAWLAIRVLALVERAGVSLGAVVARRQRQSPRRHASGLPLPAPAGVPESLVPASPARPRAPPLAA